MPTAAETSAANGNRIRRSREAVVQATNTEPAELPRQMAVRRRRPTIGYRISSNRRNTTSSNHNHTTSRKRVARAAVPPCWVTEASRPTTRMQQLCHIISITSHNSSSITAAITSSRRCRIITISHSSSSSRVTNLRRMLACAQTATPIIISKMMGTVATAACRIIAEGTRIFRAALGHRISRGVTRGEEKTTWIAAVALCTAAVVGVSGRAT